MKSYTETLRPDTVILSHYSMQIVGGLVFVTNPAADVSDREAALSYGAQFVGAGGLVHLHKLLTSCDVEAFR